jgi:hypothetical protein
MPWNSVVLERWWPDHPWRFQSTAEWAANHKGSVLLLTPLPGGLALQLDAEPVSLSPDGFATWTSSAWTAKGRPLQPVWALAWHEIETIGVTDHDLLVNSRLVHRYPTRTAADVLAAHLERLRDANEDQREIILREIAASRSDPVEIERRLDDAVDATRVLRWAGTAQWIYMFVVIPLVLSRLGGSPILLGLAGGLFGFALVNACFFVAAHRKLCPNERWKRVESAILMVLSWPMAARAADLVTRHHLSSFDPVAVALSLPDAGGRSDFIHRVIRDATHPLEMEKMAPEADRICRWHMWWSRDSLIRLVNTSDPQFADPDEQHVTGSHGDTFCPRCLETYDGEKEICSDCPGVRLRRVQHPKGE